MPDFTDHNEVIELRNDARDVETDNRERSREANRFIDDKDGQWEDHIFAASDNKPRYTFDMTSAIVDQIAGEMEQASFDIRIKPAGGEATKDDAMMRDGIIRNIENISNAKHIYNAAGRSMVTGGIAGWRVKQRFVNANSFDQDLIISPILDFTNRVWFDPSAKEQTKLDSEYAFLDQPISKEKYETRFPEGSGSSVSTTTNNRDFGFRPDDIFLSQIYYKKEIPRKLLLMSDGRVLEDNEDFAKIKDELEAAGITVERERERPRVVVMSRLFDASDWLVDEEETVFGLIPIIPIYGNYKIDNNKTKYRGVVEKMIDAQRVLNYSLSREIEEGALAPRAKIWMTEKQGAGHEDTIATLNTNSDPVQFYNVDQEAPGVPQQTGGAAINPGLRTISEGMRGIIGQSAGLFAANMGDNPGLQSGIAIERLQNKGDTGTVTYFSSLEIGICHTGQIINEALPLAYDTKRLERILKEDGTFDMTMLNDQVLDEETNQLVTVNDLSKGTYDVTCSAGPSFQNRQQEAVTGIIETAKVDPSIISLGGDILLNNMTFPGAEQIAERKRDQLFKAGAIPITQMTDEEKQQLQQAQAQPKEPNAQDQAALMIGEAELTSARTKEQELQLKAQGKGADVQIALRKEDRADAVAQDKINTEAVKNAQSAEKNQFDQIMQVQKQQSADTAAIGTAVKTMAETLKLIQEAAAGPVTGPGFVQNVKEQSDLVTDAQAIAESNIP